MLKIETTDAGYNLLVDYERREALIANLDVVGKFHAEQVMARGAGGESRGAGASGHAFRDPALLAQALTHRSAGSPHNERLEFPRRRAGQPVRRRGAVPILAQRPTRAR